MFTVYLIKSYEVHCEQQCHRTETSLSHTSNIVPEPASSWQCERETRVTREWLVAKRKRQWEAENLARFLLPAFLCAQIFIARHTSGYEVVAGAVLAEGIWFSKCCIQLTVSKDAFHLSELSGQTIPVILRISSFNQNYPVRPVRCQIACSKEIVFQQKLLEKSIFHCQNDWFCYDPVGQFWLLESVLRRTMSVLQRVK